MGKVVMIVLGVGAFAGAFAAFQAGMILARPQTPKEVQAQLEKDVASIKQTLPQKVHPLVTWFDVEAGRQTIIYKYKIHAPREVVLAKRTQMETELKNSGTISAARALVPKGVRLRCELYDEHQSFLYGIDLD
jgi:hypothetical protein